MYIDQIQFGHNKGEGLRKKGGWEEIENLVMGRNMKQFQHFVLKLFSNNVAIYF